MRLLILFYDNYCPNCTRFARLIQKLDWLQRIQIKQLRNETDLKSFQGIDLELAKQQMASYTNDWNYGYISLFRIFLRIPLLWILLPFFYFLKVTKIGHYLYVQLALKRKIIPLHCDKNTCSM
jgi:predicted DCC family thiol-disulfide oxidoreductase YuxK